MKSQENVCDCIILFIFHFYVCLCSVLICDFVGWIQSIQNVVVAVRTVNPDIIPHNATELIDILIIYFKWTHCSLMFAPVSHIFRSDTIQFPKYVL